MMLKAFSLLDQKVGTFSPPFFMAHVGQAIRAVTDLGQDLNTTVGRHPADFALCQVGAFDDQTGQFEAMVPLHLGLVLGFLPTQHQVHQVHQVGASDAVGMASERAFRPNGVAPHSDEGA